MIRTENVTRLYGTVMGLNEVSLSLGPGVYGLLGPNGSGKTTLLRLIIGQLRPSLGRVRVFGESPWNNPKVLARIGYCPDIDAFFPNTSARQFVQLLLQANGMARSEAEDRTKAALQRVGATEFADRKIDGYSKGMRQRTKVAQAIAHEPSLVILDEPLNGTDPRGRRDMIDLIRHLGDNGVSVIVSSHVLHEVQAMTEQFVLLFRGRLLANGRVSEIRNLMSDVPHRVALRCPDARALSIALSNALPIDSTKIVDQNESLIIETRDPDAFFPGLAAMVQAGEISLYEMQTDDDDLEAVFRYLTEG